MLKQTIEYLVNNLNSQLNPGNQDPLFVMDNVARLDVDNSANTSCNQEKVLLTIVNIEEEKTLKNDPFYVRKNDPQDGVQIEKRNPTVFVNLYLLISCSGKYEEALGRIGGVMEYFQGKNVFTAATADPLDKYPPSIEKIVLDLYSLSFEQVNHLWGVLGGKYMPSVLYRLRLVPIQANRRDKVGRIEEVQANSHVNN